MNRSNAITRAEPSHRRARPPDPVEVLGQIEDLQSRIHLAWLHRLVSISDAVRLQHRLILLRHALG